MKYFPEILTETTGPDTFGVAALRLESILQAELLIFDSRVRDGDIAALNPMNPGVLQNNRISFIQALFHMDKDVSLEIGITSYPDLNNPVGNRLEIVFFICATNRSSKRLKEKIISTFLNVKPVLDSYFPESDFRPVFDLNDLKTLRQNSIFKHCASIGRKHRTITLNSPFLSNEIGFNADFNKRDNLSDINEVNHVFQWIPSYDDWSKLVKVMLNQIEPTRVIIRMKSSSLTSQMLHSLEDKVKKCDQFLLSDLSNEITLKDQADTIRNQTLSRIDRLSEDSFNLAVFQFTTNLGNSFVSKVLGNAITGSKSGSSEGGSFWKGGFEISEIPVDKAARPGYFPETKELFSAEEVSCAFRLPDSPFDEIPPGFPVKKFRTALAMINQDNNSKQGISIGQNIHRGVENTVHIDNESRFRHCFILGQTGTGKSTLMSHMISQDIQDGKGLAVIDPHGDMIDDILGRIPRDRITDVILFDPLETSRPIGFNVLEWRTIQERDLIIDEMYQILHQIYDFSETGGPIFEQYFRGALGLLMGDKSRPHFTATILDFISFFLDSNFRDYLKKTVKDVHLHDFLEQAERAGGEATLMNLTPYISSKFTRFQDTILKRIVGQSSTSFSFDEIMNTGKIFLMKLGKGRFGSVTSALLANMVVSRFKLAAMKRSDIPASQRKDFFVYIDEAHNLPAENFMELLAEARKYRLGLVLATQYAAQLKRSVVGTQDNLLSALIGNVGQTVVFRLGQEDALEMAASFAPSFDIQDILSLPNWIAYVRMQDKNNALPPFSLKTSLNKTPYRRDIAGKIKISSQFRYGMDATLVDEAILKRRSVWKG